MTHAQLVSQIARDNDKPPASQVETLKGWRAEKRQTIASLLSANRAEKHPEQPSTAVRIHARQMQVTELSAQIRELNEVLAKA